MSFKNSLKDTSFHIFIKLFRDLSLSRMLVEFILKAVYFTMFGKTFQIYGVHIPRKCIESRNFYWCQPTLLHSKLFPKFLLSLRSQREITDCRKKCCLGEWVIYWFSQAAFCSNICFPQQQKGMEESMIYFIKIQSEKMKMTWNIRLFTFCMIRNFYKCDSFIVF